VAPVEPVGACGEGGPCITFASSGTYTGNLGGLVGADAICNQLAGEAGLPGTYMAWLSDRSVGGSPAQRFATRSSGPYQLVNGTRVVANWNDLVDGTLAHAIDLDENGNPADSDPDEAVWTATTSAGGHSGWGNPLDDCDGWTIGTSDGEGMIGLYFQTDGRWTNVGGVQTCEKRNLIYCFQQS